MFQAKLLELGLGWAVNLMWKKVTDRMPRQESPPGHLQPEGEDGFLTYQASPPWLVGTIPNKVILPPKRNSLETIYTQGLNILGTRERAILYRHIPSRLHHPYLQTSFLSFPSYTLFSIPSRHLQWAQLNNLIFPRHRRSPQLGVFCWILMVRIVR